MLFKINKAIYNFFFNFNVIYYNKFNFIIYKNNNKPVVLIAYNKN